MSRAAKSGGAGNGGRAANGGMPARRAVVRWAWRMFRREWRQQVLVMALLTFTVMGSLLLIVIAYNLPNSPDARFGTATQLVGLSGDTPTLNQQLDEVRKLAAYELIGHRSASIPGLTRSVDLRAQDPNGRYGRPMLRLVSGRYPTAANEAAVTDEIAALTGVRLGGRLTLDGYAGTVVGIVENPGDLSAEFVLVPPAFADPPQSVTVLTSANLNDANLTGSLESREGNPQQVAAATVFSLVALAMLLVGLVAVAAFVAVAQRRRRHFGLLAATGATERHVRLVLIANGAVAGVAAALAGTAAAIPLWMVIRPPLEVGASHRIGLLDVPLAWLGACLLLALVTAVGAAWWPGRAASRIPVTQALSMRPPRPKPAHRLAIVAVLLLAAGALALRLSHQEKVPLIIAGLVGVTLGLAFLGGPAVRLAGALGRRFTVAPRLALRDLARYQSRSGAALAAISLALAVPAFIVVQSAAEAPPGKGNLADRQMLIRVGQGEGGLIPDRTAEQNAAVEAAVRAFTRSLGTPTVITLDVAMADPQSTPPPPGPDGRPGGRSPVLLGEVIREQNRVTGVHTPDQRNVSGTLYIGSPALLRQLNLDANAFRPGVDVLSVAPMRSLVFLPDAERIVQGAQPQYVVMAPMRRADYRSLPDQLINPATVQQRGWATVRAGWLVEAGQPVTAAQIRAARSMALDYGLSVEVRDSQPYLWQMRVSAVGSGGVLALGVLAMTVGLIRGEATRDLRTLTATGATRRIRRTLGATTAGALALLGALLGTGVVYLALAAIHDDDIGKLAKVPVYDLTAILVGIPLVAVAAAWLLAGREPRTISRMSTD